MNLEQVIEAAVSTKKNSINLEKLFSRSVITTNEVEAQRLRAKTQLLETRQKTYAAIKQSQEEQEKKDGILEKIIGNLGLAGLAKGLKGAKPPTGGTGVISPKPRPGGPRIGRGVVGLNVLFGGIDFMQRRSAGQSNLQAGIGAGAGVAGGMAGAALGAKIGAGLGTLIAPGLGTLIGGGLGTLVGGGIGAMAAGNIADRATGVDAGEVEIDRRLQEEEKRTSFLISKTPFSAALDTFDAALDKLASFPGGICACAQKIEVPGSAAISVPKDKLQEAYNIGYSKGIKDGGTTGAAAGFVAGVAVVGGVLFLTRGKGGALLQRIGAITDLVPKSIKKPEVSKADPGKVRVIPKEEVPAPSTPVERIMQGAPREGQTVPNIRKIQKQRAEKVELVEEVIDTPEGQVIIRRPATKVEKSTPEEFFQKQELKGLKQQNKIIKRRIEPVEEVSPIGPQSSLGGSNLIALSEPNTNIVPIPVGGGSVVVGRSGTTPYQAAAKYAQMMSQITV